MRIASPLSGLLWILIATSLAAAAPPTPTIRIEQPWARATPPGVQVGAAYAVIQNTGNADRLLAVETPVSGRVEIHKSSHSNGQMQMRQVASLDVPARSRVAFEPSGLHLMLVDLKQPLRAGQQLTLTFVFEKAGRITAQAPIAPLGSTSAPAEDNHAGHH